MAKIFYLFILSAILFVGCEVNPPITSAVTGQYGDLYVYSPTIDSVQVYVDNVLKGITPCTIKVSIGKHDIRLVKTGYSTKTTNIEIQADQKTTLAFSLFTSNKTVLIEEFSNVSCIPCVTANKIMYQLEHGYFNDKAVIIKYPANFPAPNDPMYLQNKDVSDIKMAYYNIISTPTIIFDGQTRAVSSDSANIKTNFDNALNLTSIFGVNVVKTISNNNINIKVNVENLDSAGVDYSNLSLRIAIVETEVDYSSAPGLSGETKFYNVCRAMIPSGNGEDLTISPLSSTEINKQLSLNSSWDAAKLRTVVFIQDKKTKKVYQTAFN